MRRDMLLIVAISSLSLAWNGEDARGHWLHMIKIRHSDAYKD